MNFIKYVGRYGELEMDFLVSIPPIYKNNILLLLCYFVCGIHKSNLYIDQYKFYRPGKVYLIKKKCRWEAKGHYWRVTLENPFLTCHLNSNI